MSKKILSISLSALLLGFLISGFIFMDKNPFTKTNINPSDNNHQQPAPYTTNNVITYTDNFDGANDTTSLKARGYKVYYRGAGPQGLTATWFQGDPLVFSAYNGPSTGYVAANYNVVTNTNNIDSWLVFPRLSGGIALGDSLYFYSQATPNSIYPDSIRVMYSANDSVPEGTWTDLGRFQVNTAGTWQLKGFRATSTSANGRFAIRYNVVNGGPSGLNSDYIGIDAATIVSSLVGIQPIGNSIPKEYSLNQNYPNPFNPTTNIKFAIPKSGNVKLVIFDITGREVRTLVNQYKTAGNYVVDFNASEVASGVYFYKIESGDFTQVKKMILVK